MIATFYVVSAGFTLLSFSAVLTGAVRLNEAQLDYYAGLSDFDWFSSFLVGALTLIAVTLLFLLRRAALPLFAIVLVLNLSLNALHLLTKPLAAALGGSGLAGAVLGWCLMAGVYVYARRLKLRGLLR